MLTSSAWSVMSDLVVNGWSPCSNAVIRDVDDWPSCYCNKAQVIKKTPFTLHFGM